MEWLERMNRVLDYLEKNMDGEINFDKVAKLAMRSSYHFHRMFSFITEIPLAEYIRRRRLTLAAQEFQNSQEKVIDIAVKYGYDSPDAFTRAFQKLHGVTPTVAREPGTVLKAYPRITFRLIMTSSLKTDQDCSLCHCWHRNSPDILIKDVILNIYFELNIPRSSVSKFPPPTEMFPTLSQIFSRYSISFNL
jgi:AraC-like DNA-binding protein